MVIVTEHQIDESDLLLKLFVLEVGSALRSIRAFSQGSMNADLDGISLKVINAENQILGTVSAPMSTIISYLEGNLTVNEALGLLEISGVFESFLQN